LLTGRVTMRPIFVIEDNLKGKKVKVQQVLLPKKFKRSNYYLKNLKDLTVINAKIKRLLNAFNIFFVK
jgi:hypothetical protein